MSVEFCNVYCGNSIEETVVSVDAVDSLVLLDAIDFISSSWLFRVSVCSSNILFKVLMLLVCIVCVVIRLSILELDS